MARSSEEKAGVVQGIQSQTRVILICASGSVVIATELLLPLVFSRKSARDMAAFLGVSGSLRQRRALGWVRSVRKDRVECTGRFTAIYEEEWGKARRGLGGGVVGVSHTW